MVILTVTLFPYRQFLNLYVGRGSSSSLRLTHLRLHFLHSCFRFSLFRSIVMASSSTAATSKRRLLIIKRVLPYLSDIIYHNKVYISIPGDLQRCIRMGVDYCCMTWGMLQIARLLLVLGRLLMAIPKSVRLSFMSCTC